MNAPTRFAPLPYTQTSAGEPRLTGVEVEFSGLDIEQTTRIVQDSLGGASKGDDPFLRSVVDTSIGDIEIELDTPIRHASDNKFVRHGLDAAAVVVPMEIITGPLDHDGLMTFNGFLSDLRDAGAAGSRAGVFLGFGVHLNPEVVSLKSPHTINTIRAYGLLEAYLRRVEAVDMTRRALPFVEPWPADFLTALCDQDIETLAQLLPIAAKHISSRNHGLDILPLLKFAQPEAYGQHFTETKSNARPTFHFRLPDCRIDEPDWDLNQPWELWRLVERVAAHPAAIGDLASAWKQRRTGIFHTRAWAEDTASVLRKYDLEVAS